MSKILFLSKPTPADGETNLKLASEMVGRGDKVTFFGTAELKQTAENIGADFRSYSITSDAAVKLDKDVPKSGLITALLEPMKFIDNIMVQIRGLKFDYAVFDPAYPYANIIKQLLGIPEMNQQIIN